MRSVGKNLSLTLRAVPEAVSFARGSLSEFALAAGADRDQADAVRLAASEALTNAVVHAYGDEPGNVYVTAALVSDEFWVLIADDGRGLEPRTDKPGLGLGLGIMAQVSDELAIVPRAGGGIEVRMRFDLVPDRAGIGHSGASWNSPAPVGDELGPRTRPASFRSRQLYA